MEALPIDKSRIALAFIVKDEGKYAIQMIRSVLPIVGMVSCIDTSESHEARDLINTYLDIWRVPRLVIPASFCGFDTLRNLAIQGIPRCFEWILMLDADEVFLPDDLPAVFGLTLQTEVDAWAFPRFNWRDKLLGERYEPYPDHQGRLFRNNGVIQYGGAVHETIQHAANMRGLDPAASRVPHIHHLKYVSKTEAALEEREVLYRRIIATGA